MPVNFPSGYPTPVEMRGTAGLSILDDPFQEAVGKPVFVEVSMDANTTTSFNQSFREFEVDLGALLADAIVVGATRYTVSQYAIRGSMLVRGLLRSSLAGKYTLKVRWGLKHDKSPDDQYDGINFVFGATLKGFGISQIVRVHDSDQVDAITPCRDCACGCEPFELVDPAASSQL